MSINPNLSALIDGELSASETDAMLTQLVKDKNLQNQWHVSITARAVLREKYVVEAEQNGAFAAKVASLINAEAALVGPNNLWDVNAQNDNVVAFPTAVKSNSKLPAALMLAAAASFATVTFLNINPLGTDQSTSTQLASTSSSDVVNAIPAANFLAAEQEMQALVVAHGEFSSMAGLNGLAAYAKIVNVDGAQ